jgi:hypothetical protein
MENAAALADLAVGNFIEMRNKTAPRFSGSTLDVGR